jgi:hypothetical protein
MPVQERDRGSNDLLWLIVLGTSIKRLLGDAVVEGFETVLGGRVIGQGSDDCCTDMPCMAL